jgi:uncharacterized protein (TIGR02001 family)
MCALSTLTAHAANDWGGSLTATSDYVFRGVSQTRGAAALQADVHWRREDRWLAGAWASTVDLNPGAGPTFEVNVYAGRNWRVGSDWSARLLAVHYAYPNDTRQHGWDYDELVATVGFRERLAATVAWSPNTTGFADGRVIEDRVAVSYELNANFPWRHAWVFSTGVGYHDLEELFGSGYTFWNLGVTYGATPWQLTLARFGTDSQATDFYGSETTEDRWSLAIQWHFDGGMP